jgi:hypothetical protein
MPLPCGSPLPCAFSFFFIFFISVLFFLLLMFISPLVLYFVDYILVLLNTMCIYPDFCNTTYSTLSSPPPPPTHTHTHIYIRVSEQSTLRGNFLKLLSHMCQRGGHASQIALPHLSHILWTQDNFGGGCYPRSAMYGETLARCTRAVYPLDFQSVIACVPTGWSHLSDSSTTPISIYYAQMIALDGVATPEARCTAKP